MVYIIFIFSFIFLVFQISIFNQILARISENAFYIVLKALGVYFKMQQCYKRDYATAAADVTNVQTLSSCQLPGKSSCSRT